MKPNRSLRWHHSERVVEEIIIKKYYWNRKEFGCKKQDWLVLRSFVLYFILSFTETAFLTEREALSSILCSYFWAWPFRWLISPSILIHNTHFNIHDDNKWDSFGKDFREEPILNKKTSLQGKFNILSLQGRILLWRISKTRPVILGIRSHWHMTTRINKVVKLIGVFGELQVRNWKHGK